MPSDFDDTRRQLLAGSVGIAMSLYTARGMAATEAGGPTAVDEGTVAGGTVSFPATTHFAGRPR